MKNDIVFVITNKKEFVKKMRESSLDELYFFRELNMLIAAIGDQYPKSLEQSDKIYFVQETLDLLNEEIRKRETELGIGGNESYG